MKSITIACTWTHLRLDVHVGVDHCAILNAARAVSEPQRRDGLLEGGGGGGDRRDNGRQAFLDYI